MSSASLLRAAADALEEGRSPLDAPFLGDNSVPLEQAYSLADLLAIGARVVADGIEHPTGLAGQAMLLEMARRVQ